MLDCRGGRVGERPRGGHPKAKDVLDCRGAGLSEWQGRRGEIGPDGADQEKLAGGGAGAGGDLEKAGQMQTVK